MPVIEIINAFKTYRSRRHEVSALKGINLTVENGEFLSVVGHSGSGKTTLMNILGCLDTLTKGQYRLKGKDTAYLGDKQLSYLRNNEIGFIFQSFNLLPGLTAYENVELPLIYRKISKRERKAAVKKALETVGLEDRMNHLPCEMSGGQQQRAAIARAIASDPSIILADEPTGNLDSGSRDDVMRALKRLNSKGCTIVMITHDDAVAGYAHRRVSINDGYLQ